MAEGRPSFDVNTPEYFVTVKDLVPRHINPKSSPCVKVFISDLKVSTPGSLEIVRNGKPLEYIEILGTVVNKKQSRETLFSYTLDDGTGLAQCNVFYFEDGVEERRRLQDNVTSELRSEDLAKPVKDSLENLSAQVNEDFFGKGRFELGDLLHVRGKIQFNKQQQLYIKPFSIVKVRDSNAETLHWLEVSFLRSQGF